MTPTNNDLLTVCMPADCWAPVVAGVLEVLARCADAGKEPWRPESHDAHRMGCDIARKVLPVLMAAAELADPPEEVLVDLRDQAARAYDEFGRPDRRVQDIIDNVVVGVPRELLQQALERDALV